MSKVIDMDLAVRTVRGEVEQYHTPVVDLIAIQTKDPYKVLTATILSARTKDEVTSKAAARLFKKAGNIHELSRLSPEEISKIIYPVGFFRSKAGYLAALPEALEPFAYRVPDDMESLLSLPGVGRKTANLVLAAAFNIPAICVDTHVHRIMNIWGYVRSKTPFETEMQLREKLPEKYWLHINSLLVSFGQGKCRPVSPKCHLCPLDAECPKIGVVPSKKTESRTPVKEKNEKLFISWNVNGLRAVGKRGFAEFVRSSGADIFAVQETKAHPEQLPGELRDIPGYQSYWASARRKGYSGVGIYTKKRPVNVIPGTGKEEYDLEGRVITLEFDDFFFVNAYFPNAQHKLLRLDYKLNFNDALLNFTGMLAKEKSVIVCGDFNVAHKPVDLKNPESNGQNPGFSPEERAWMDRFTEKAGYIDTFRKFNSDPEQYTWWSYRFNAREKNIGWRIDYFCVDRKSDKRVIAGSILNDVTGSDHCPVSLRFR